MSLSYPVLVSLDKEIKDAFIQLVRDDVIAQRKENGQAFFVDEEVYDKCYPSSVKEVADDSSLSKLLLRYHPPPLMSPSVLEKHFGSNVSRAHKLVTLLSIGGEYGYHLLYMALREDGKKKAVEELEETGMQSDLYITRLLGISKNNSWGTLLNIMV